MVKQNRYECLSYALYFFQGKCHFLECYSISSFLVRLTASSTSFCHVLTILNNATEDLSRNVPKHTRCKRLHTTRTTKHVYNFHTTQNKYTVLIHHNQLYSRTIPTSKLHIPQFSLRKTSRMTSKNDFNDLS